LGRCRLGGGSLVVEGEEVGEDLLGGEGLTINFQRPAVDGEDGLVEGALGVREPGGALVVEVGEGALLEVGFGDGRFAGRGFWVEPVVAQGDE
jgi:hypothetical protein